ncbi:C3H1-type domain-containing protein [Durusdinium trenchii]|uniref:C3H1-type domain-containing protein n=1 Tax=Durusdinium trenchii TaxID=1381693 RepID=A0ABP0SF20_9DINO
MAYPLNCRRTFLDMEDIPKVHNRSRYASEPPPARRDEENGAIKEQMQNEKYAGELPMRALNKEFLVSKEAQIRSSEGSRGHPDLCKRPCIIFAKTGTCQQGSDCAFCHFAHPNRSVLDKRQRLTIRTLNEAQKWTLTLPYLAAKLETWKAKEHDATSVLALIEARLAVLQSSGMCGEVSPKVVKLVDASLVSINFGAILSLVLSSEDLNTVSHIRQAVSSVIASGQQML